MRKFLALIICLVTVFSVSACTISVENGDNNGYVLMAPDGAPGIVVSKIVSDGKVGNKTVNTSIIGGADEIVTNVANGTAQMAVMPLNLAARAYNTGSDIKLVSVNVFGSLYMVGKTQIESVNDLVGKVVYNIGKGGTPDMTFKYILQQKGIEVVESDVAVDGKIALQYVTAASELVPLLKSGVAEFGIMGEPAVTNCNNVAGTQTVLDIQSEWQKITGDTYTQAGFVVSGTLAKDTAFMSELVKTLSDTSDWAKSNASSIKELLGAKGSTLAINYTEDILSRCNVGFASAKDAKEDIEKYFNVLISFNEKVVGGKLPDNGFYYGL